MSSHVELKKQLVSFSVARLRLKNMSNEAELTQKLQGIRGTSVYKEKIDEALAKAEAEVLDLACALALASPSEFSGYAVQSSLVTYALSITAVKHSDANLEQLEKQLFTDLDLWLSDNKHILNEEEDIV